MAVEHEAGLTDAAHSRTAAPPAVEPEDERAHGLAWPEAARIAFVAFSAAAVWFQVWEPIAGVSPIGIVGLVVGGWPIFREALENLLARRMTMELSMTIAIVAAAAIGEFFTALVIALFVLVAEVLERMTVSRGRHAIRDLLEFLPRSVSVRRAGGVRDVDSAELRVGDAVLVNPGARVPVDGTVLRGHSFLDQSRITGESMPVEKTAGSAVYAGSINQSGAIEIRAERLGRDTSFGKIIEAVERAEKSRAPVQRLADRMAGYLVYFALGAAALTYLITRDMRSTISVVIVAGACGISALVDGTTVLVGNCALLTERSVAVPRTLASQEEAASEILVARDGRLLGAIVVADSVRPEAKPAVEALARMRMRTILLTGDTKSVADAVGGRLGIAEVHADLLPEDKLARIKDLVGRGCVVAMLGDAINDAPALTEANVGVAMRSGTAVARESRH